MLSSSPTTERLFVLTDRGYAVLSNSDLIDEEFSKFPFIDSDLQNKSDFSQAADRPATLHTLLRDAVTTSMWSS